MEVKRTTYAKVLCEGDVVVEVYPDKIVRNGKVVAKRDVILWLARGIHDEVGEVARFIAEVGNGAIVSLKRKGGKVGSDAKLA